MITKDIDYVNNDEALDILSLSVLKEFQHKSSLARETPHKPKKHQLRCPRSAAAVTKNKIKFDKPYPNVYSLKQSPERSMRSNRKINMLDNNNIKNNDSILSSEKINHKSMSDKIHVSSIISTCDTDVRHKR